MNKTELRKIYLEKRLALSPERRQSYSEKICENFLKNFQVEGKLISLFLPIEKKLEINTYLLMDRIQSLGASICLPKSDFSSYEMSHIVYDGSTVLETNKYGIPEPQKGYEIEVDRIAIVVVPLLICDKNGNRVGYGKGFYDRFLKQCSPQCKFVGLNYFEPTEIVSDALEEDVPLDALITPDHHFLFQ
jgi:5-formyltetrahydrofolate cyclo-ligase